MKKKVLMLLVACTFVVIFVGCGVKDSKITKSLSAEDLESNEYFDLYETNNRDEYLSFLKNFDTSKYRVLDTSIGYYGKTLGDYINHYAVTYTDIETFNKIVISNDLVTSSGDIYIYETTDRDDYILFLKNFVDSKYELLDISIGYNGKSFGDYYNHYAVTYKIN